MSIITLCIWIQMFSFFQITVCNKLPCQVKTKDSPTDNLFNINTCQEWNKVNGEKRIEEKQPEKEEGERFQNIKSKLMIKCIEQRMFNIEQCYFNPQTLTISG